jgi:hypothetical protein
MDGHFHGRSLNVYGYSSRNCDTAADHYAASHGDAASHGYPTADVYSVANRYAAANHTIAGSYSVCSDRPAGHRQRQHHIWLCQSTPGQCDAWWGSL